MMNIQKMMQQAQEMQFKLQEMQEKLKDIEVEAESGGGMVKITMTCAGTVTGLNIDPSLLTSDNKEMVEDLVIAAVNNAGETRDKRVQEETNAMMQAMGLPAGTKLPF